MLKLIGGAIFLWGLADLGLSWAGIDLWWEIGVKVPDGIYPYTHYIAFIVGGLIVYLGDNGEDEDEQAQ